MLAGSTPSSFASHARTFSKRSLISRRARDHVRPLRDDGDAGLRAVAAEGGGEAFLYRRERGHEAAPEGIGVDAFAEAADLGVAEGPGELVDLPLVGHEEAGLVGARDERLDVVLVQQRVGEVSA